MDYWIQPSHQFLVVVTKFTESLSLRSKNGRDGLLVVTSVELGGKGMGA
jgi:hypothetical protein